MEAVPWLTSSLDQGRSKRYTEEMEIIRHVEIKVTSSRSVESMQDAGVVLNTATREMTTCLNCTL